MTPAEKEVEKVNLAYHSALVVMSSKLAVQVMTAFKSVNLDSAASFADFAAKVAAMIYLNRKKARDLSVAETQLERALLTGSTYQDWVAPFESSPSLGELRSNFYSKLTEFNINQPLRARDLGPELKVSVDLIPEIETAEKELNRAIDKEVQDTLRLLGEETIKTKLSLVKDDMSVADARKLEEEIRTTASSNLASGSQRIALNGARHNDSNVIKFDNKVVGWARVHSASAPDEPCGWCSMLMSRGAVYRTEQAANLDGIQSEFAKYHGSCHCIAVKVYTKAQYDSERFAKNREYNSLWPKVTQGLSGDAAVSAWRKFIRERSKSIQPKATAIQEIAA